jgi:hypothetical protein
MRDNVNVQVNLEAEDTLAVRLISLQVTGPATTRSPREMLESQAQTLLDKCTFLEGGALALIEADGVSNASLLRSAKPQDGKFVQIVLRGGNSILLETRGGATHLSRENYEKLLGVLTELVA